MSPLPVRVMKLALVRAFQEQPVAVVTTNKASPPAAPNDSEELEAEKDGLGMGVTVFVLLCSAIPTGAVESVWLFETKLAAGTLGMIGSAWLIYRFRQRS